MEQGPTTSGKSTRNKRAIPALALIQGVAAIGGMMIKGINALVDAKRASSYYQIYRNLGLLHAKISLELLKLNILLIVYSIDRNYVNAHSLLVTTY